MDVSQWACDELTAGCLGFLGSLLASAVCQGDGNDLASCDHALELRFKHGVRGEKECNKVENSIVLFCCEVFYTTAT